MSDIDIKQIQDSKNGALLFIWETVIIIISLAIILPIRYYLVQPFFVKGASMEPNFDDKDYLLIDELSYRFNPPKRGEVIVFRYPYDDEHPFYIKRIIGLPDETVEIRNNIVKIFNDERKDGFTLKEIYLDSSQKTLGDMVVRLKNEEYFVMGDNRLQSSDSRRWGTLNKKFITGRAMIRLWPVDMITKFEQVQYN